MKTSKKKQSTGNSRITRQHQAKKAPVLVYIILLVAVSVIMITLNQNRKRNDESLRSDTKTSEEFVKEGELGFFKANGEKITEIDIEIADDDLQTERGMMYRRSLKDERGMLFIFPDEQERSFWMKNTYIPLDIIYLDANRIIVSITENAQPRSEQSIWSEAPAKYVVEVNAGFTALHRIAKGDSIDFKRTYR